MFVEELWLSSRRQLRPEDESISRKKAGQKGVAGGPCYPGKTECPFSTSCEWDRDTEDGEEFRERICVHKDLVPANGRASVQDSHHDSRYRRDVICSQARLGDDFSPDCGDGPGRGRRHRGRRATGAHI